MPHFWSPWPARASASAGADAGRQAACRKHDAQEVLAGVGLDLDDDMVGIGVVFEHLGPSQAVYFGINTVNPTFRTGLSPAGEQRLSRRTARNSDASFRRCRVVTRCKRRSGPNGTPRRSPPKDS